MDERLPTIGETVKLGTTNDSTGDGETGTVIALMGLRQGRRWSAVTVIDRGDTYDSTRYLVGWTFRQDVYSPDMHAFKLKADALESMHGRWQIVAAEHADLEPRVWHAGDPEPEVGTRIVFGFEVWVRHHQLLWVCEFSLGTGALGIEWHRLLDSAAAVGVAQACSSQYVLIDEEERHDSRCRDIAGHAGLHINRAGFAWDAADAAAAMADKAGRA